MAIQHKNNFNFLRLCLANLVLLSHAPELIDGDRRREILTRLGSSISFGELAVAGFFILSGYLIVQSWVRKPDALDFLTRRIRRILPAFVVASVLCAFVIGPMASTDASQYFGQFDLKNYLLSVLTLGVPITPPVFVGTNYAITNGAVWTISYEFCCYLTVLIAGFLGLLKGRRWWLLMTLALLLICMIDKNGYPYWRFKHLNLYLGVLFGTGGCFFLFREYVTFARPKILFAAIIFVVGISSKHTELLAVSVAGGYLLFALAFAKIGMLRGFDRFPDVSYGAYLYGWPIQKLVLWYAPSTSPWLLFPVSVCLALIAGTLSWYGIERWFMQNKKRPPTVVEAVLQ